ncbi:glutamate ABC transporter substrate-binding protein [Streptomyces sp. BI20]|uniref:glutamate ABC transporter substrate-binding protein n=1 Tax=Streptomyces sp. BI20 TaxID=3403460 RepID=UPI003C74132F
MAAACAMTAAVALLPLSGVGPEVPREPAAATLLATPATGPGGPPALPALPSTECDDKTNATASLKPSTADGDAVKRIKSAGKLVAGVDQNSYMWGYANPSAPGGLDGFDIALVKAIAKEILGDENAVIYRAIPTSQRIPALKEGRVDVVVRTMTINCKRLADVAFSTAYFTAGQQVLAPAVSKITGYDESLAGKRICVATGSTAEAALTAKSFGAKAVPVPNQLDCLVRTQLGEVDGVITDNALAAGQIAQDPSMRLVGEPFTTEYYGVAMNKGAEDLVRRVNKVLEDYRAGGANSAWRRAYDNYLRKAMGDVGSTPPQPLYRD